MLRKALVVHCITLILIFASSSWAFNTAKLQNGVNIITQKMDSETAVLDVWVRVGGRNENPEICGISHFIEHLIFKGSKKYKAGEMEKLIEECGGIFNAATSKDFTHFYAVVPKQYFTVACDVISDAIANPLFPPDELEKERKVILEEIFRHSSQPQMVLYDLLYAKSFSYHPYRYPVLGTILTISNLSRDNILNYFNSFYRGQNIKVIAAGGLGKDAENYLKKAFEGIPALSGQNSDPETEILSENVLLEMKKQTAKTYMDIAFSSPPASSFDSYVMDLITTILGNGRNSRLNKNLKEDLQLVNSIKISYPTPIDPNLIVIDVVCDKDKADSATQKIFEELNLLKTKEVSDYERIKAINKLEMDYKINHSAPQSVVSNLGYFATVANIDYEDHYIEQIKNITAADIMRAAKQYFQYYTIVRFIPND